MTITCPSCGFAGGFGATMPTEAGRAAGRTSQAVDLVDNPAYLNPEPGELAICSNCGVALVFTGWMEISPPMFDLLGPEAQKMIRDGQEAVRKLRGGN